ncbi:MAG: glycosyltransferase family 4 protein, partial [Candidatus Omnitrophica bacterium]|nr:glycosyltransferase family 4 protein [Candidatus Omnitrophota bacterium]
MKKGTAAIKGLSYIESSFSSDNRILRILWEQVVLPLLIKKYEIKLLHCPVNIAPLACNCKTVVTVHDLSFMKLKKSHNYLQMLYLKKFTSLSCKKADKIIAVSKSTKKDIVECCKIPEDKIQVIYNGISDEFKIINDNDGLNDIKNKYSLPDKFLLYVGTLEPRKNVPAIIKAFQKCQKDNKFDYKLVIAGSKGWAYQEIFTLVKELSLSKDVTFTGYIENNDLPYLYNLAKLLVYPSLYEGFGLPLIESMACGTPVV